MITLLLFTASKFKKYCSKDGAMATKAEKMINNIFEQVRICLSDEWIVKHYTPMFGEPSSYTNKFSQDKEDVKVICTL